MNILNESIEKKIHNEIIIAAVQNNFESTSHNIQVLQDELYSAIPDSKRISYGRVYTIKVLSGYLYDCFTASDAPVFEIGSGLFEISSEYRSKGVSLGLLSLYGLKNYKRVLPYFKSAAVSEEWDVREMAQMFFRKLINKYPDEIRKFPRQLVTSENAMIRRFVSETLRPVQENKWFFKKPEYSLSVLRNMFQEKSPYPRTSVGNNLSDLTRCLPELVFEIVEELVVCGNKNSYWIAYRTCRNLVKKEPLRVLDVLKVDEYTYKKRIHKRSDYQ